MINVGYGYDGKDVFMLNIMGIDNENLILFEVGILGFYFILFTKR